VIFRTGCENFHVWISAARRSPRALLAGVAHEVRDSVRGIAVRWLQNNEMLQPAEAIMCDIPVFYATTEGQTRRIAERLTQRLRERGFTSKAIDVETPEANAIDWHHVRGAFLGASLHAGKHQTSAEAFARAHAGELSAIPSTFFSVSLSAASTHAPELNAARELADKFATQTHWQPRRIACVPGRLAYTQYGFFKRMLMKQIARREHASTDTSRDHEYTDWRAVDQLAREMSDVIRHDAAPIAVGA
jgi:menaquinone-dependent protoporphyrinogen oxidase